MLHGDVENQDCGVVERLKGSALFGSQAADYVLADPTTASHYNPPRPHSAKLSVLQIRNSRMLLCLVHPHDG